MKLFDTLSGEAREFAPAGDEVHLYVCGVTPYARAHVGHAMSYIVFDVLRRYLEYRGYAVKHVQNFTDIDDKLIDRAAQEGVAVSDLAERYIDEYFQDMAALNVRNAHIYPRATQEVPTIVEIVQSLIDKGYAYEAEGDVYFRVTRQPHYGKLSHRSLDTMRAGARVEAGAMKEHLMDFVLWKSAKPNEPSWESPWGRGRPGWHIECTAMSLRYLDGVIDIHGGGQDLVFPHHENEIAQSEAFTGKPFVRFWVHNGLLHVEQEKMSKSTGKLVTIREALSKYSSDAIRLMVLNSHYRSPSYYADEALAAAERAMARLRQATIVQGGQGDALDAAPHRERFEATMDDDLNTPQALAVLFDLAHAINRAATAGQDVRDTQALLLELGRDVLGLTFEEREAVLDAETEARIRAHLQEVLDHVDGALGSLIQKAVDARSKARAEKRYGEADEMRKKLAEAGIVLEDTPSGTIWRFAVPEDTPAR